MEVVRKVLVLGGNGFIGRHAVIALQSKEAEITIGSRFAQDALVNADQSIIKHQQVSLRLETLISSDSWLDTVSEYDVILNCVGILRQRPNESYQSIHNLAPAALALACSIKNVRLVHVSALGLCANAKSRFLTSKYNGEQGIKSSTSDWIIVRPSLLDGEGGFGAQWLRGVAKLPIFAVPTSAKGKIAAMTVDDLGEALAKLCLAPSTELNLSLSREFELGGEDLMGFEEYIRALRLRYSSSRALKIPIPSIFARLGAHFCDLLHFSPFSFGHWELLCKDNVPKNNRLPELLGREPTKVTVKVDSELL